MNRSERKRKAKKVYDQSDQLHVNKKRYRKHVSRYLLEAARDDSRKDPTTKVFTSRKDSVTAKLIFKESGVAAGLAEARWIARKLGVQFTAKTKDGKRVKAGSTVAVIEGKTRDVFAIERTLVNTLQRMSGIATHTAALKKVVGKYPLLACTRKTLWGWLDKHAVHIGGGYTHRLSLDTGIMIKDNHLELIDNYKELARKSFSVKHPRILEVDSPKIAREILQHAPKVDTILLDNFTPTQIKHLLTWAKRKRYYREYLFEASGNITAGNLKKYAKTGVDCISMGSLTHSAPALDVSLEIN